MEYVISTKIKDNRFLKYYEAVLPFVINSLILSVFYLVTLFLLDFKISVEFYIYSGLFGIFFILSFITFISTLNSQLTYKFDGSGLNILSGAKLLQTKSQSEKGFYKHIYKKEFNTDYNLLVLYVNYLGKTDHFNLTRYIYLDKDLFVLIPVKNVSHANELSHFIDNIKDEPLINSNKIEGVLFEEQFDKNFSWFSNFFYIFIVIIALVLLFAILKFVVL